MRAVKRVVVLVLGTLTLLDASLGVHEKRIEEVKEILHEKGISKVRLEEIFQSKQALKLETKALTIISDITNIKKHRKFEEEANKQMLLKSALLQKHLKKYKSVYDKVERDFDVNREIVAAILQKETALGSFKRYRHNALSVYISLLKGLSPEKNIGRARIRLQRFVKFAHDNLVALISFYELRGMDVLKADLRSSYAGAVGIPQFSPKHFDMIKSPSQEDKFDLHDMPTAIYSTANLLKNRFKWKERVQYSRMKDLNKIIKRWKAFDTGSENFVYAKNLDGIRVPTFVDASKNDKQLLYIADYVKVLKRYNFSTAYALGILQIAKVSHE